MIKIIAAMAFLILGSKQTLASNDEADCKKTPIFVCVGQQKDLGHKIWLTGMSCMTEESYEAPTQMMSILRAQVIEEKSVIVDRKILIDGTYHNQVEGAKNYNYYYGNSEDLPDFTIMVDYVGNLASNYARIGKVVYPLDCNLVHF